MLLRAGDVVRLKNRPRALQLVRLNLQSNPPPAPDYLEAPRRRTAGGSRVAPAHSGRRGPAIQDIREQLIIEFCSR